MANVVYILGAGASAPSGCPILKDFFGAIRALAKTTDDAAYQNAANDIENARRKLQAVSNKINFDIDNVEDVLSAFELAKTIGKLGDLPSEVVDRLPEALTYVIARTIEERQQFFERIDAERVQTRLDAFSGEVERSYPVVGIGCQGHSLVGHHIRTLRQHKGVTATVITLNYDLGIDIELTGRGIAPDYCLQSHASHADGRIPLLKLHGSLNWHVTHDGTIEYTPTIVEKTIAGVNGKFVTKSGYLKIPCCSLLRDATSSIRAVPFIVPPTENKMLFHSRVQHVWRAAAREISEAEVIVFIGYSVPPSDGFFRRFLALALHGDQIVQRIVSVNGDESANHRLRELLAVQLAKKFVPVNMWWDDQRAGDVLSLVRQAL